MMGRSRVAIIHSLALFSEALTSLVRERGTEVVAVEPAGPGSFERVRRAGPDAVIVVASGEDQASLQHEVGLDSLDEMLVLMVNPERSEISVYRKQSIHDAGADELLSLLRSPMTLTRTAKGGLSSSGGAAGTER